MTIQALKSQIESGSITNNLIILKDNGDNFISNQYIDAIAKVSNKKITYVDSLDGLFGDVWSFYPIDTSENDSELNVLKSEVFVWGDSRIARLTNVIIVVQKFQTKELEKQFEEFIVNVPTIEDWMIKDYVYSTVGGVEHKDLDWLISLCGNNYHRLQQELDKLQLFREDERKYVFADLVRDGALDDLSSYNIFNFTNAITSKNMNMLCSVYKELDRVDVNEFGLLSVLLKNFRNLILVQLSSNPTTESTGMPPGQLYAIKKLPKVYAPQQLVNIYQFLLDIDRQVKNGELPTEIMIDYLMVKILSM